MSVNATFCNREETEDNRESLISEEKSIGAQKPISALSVLSALSVTEEAANRIAAVLNEPIQGRLWGKVVFRIARACKAIPQLADAPANVFSDLMRLWHESAGLDHPSENTVAEFLTCWDKVKFPLGQGPLENIMDTLRNAPLPDICSRYESPEMHRLIVLCHELQRLAGEGDFFLSCRMAASLCETDHITMWRYLKVLLADGVLLAVTPGTKSKAARFRLCATEVQS